MKAQVYRLGEHRWRWFCCMDECCCCGIGQTRETWAAALHAADLHMRALHRRKANPIPHDLDYTPPNGFHRIEE